MAITWGATALNVMEYSRPGAEIYLNEKKLIPDPTIASTTPQTVLMGSGRCRKRIQIKGWATISDYQSLETDMYAFTARALDMTSIESGMSFTTGIIESLSGDRVKGTSNTEYMEYDCTFLEVT